MAAVGKRIRLLLEKQPLIAHGHVIDSAAKMVEAAASVYESPLGPLEVVASEKGIVSVKFLFGKHGCDGSPGERNPEKIGGVEASRHLEECKIWLDAYFSGNLLEMDDPPSKPALVLPEKSEFFNTAWRALLTTRVGDTITYKELAQQTGRPLAARSVGQAVKSHALPILVPCHRVVPSGKKRPREKTSNTGNYSGGDGPPTKKWLLEHEQKMSKKHPQ